MPSIEFRGPTYFQQLFERFLIDIERMSGRNSNYYILLLLTDGSIHDMEETKSLIVKLSEKPVSVIIVGIGNANFKDMFELDGRDGSITDTNGNQCKRDIVQFVQFRDAIEKGDLAE